jgi:hypothetical protein
VNLFAGIENIGDLLFGRNGYIHYTIRYDQRRFSFFEWPNHNQIEATQTESFVLGTGH